MGAPSLCKMASTPEWKLGHFLVEFSSLGIGQIFKLVGSDSVSLDMSAEGLMLAAKKISKSSEKQTSANTSINNLAVGKIAGKRKSDSGSS